MRPVLLAWILAPVLLLAIAWGVPKIYFLKYENELAARRASHAEKSSRLLARFLEDQRAIELSGIFPAGAPAGEDIGPMLNPLVSWTGDPRADGPLAIAPALREVIKAARGDAWLEQLAERPEIDALDFSWMAELERFGQWDWTQGEPVQKVLAEFPGGSFFTLPLPYFVDLVDWAKLNLARGVRGKKFAVVARMIENRALARLLYSNELLVAQMAAVAIVGFEAEATRFAESRGQPIVFERITPLSEADRLAFKRGMFVAGRGVLTSPLSTPDEWRLALAARGLYGHCAGIEDQVGAAMLVLPVIDGAAPAFAPAIDSMFAAKPPCRLALARKYWRSEPYLAYYYRRAHPFELLRRDFFSGESDGPAGFPRRFWLDALPTLRDGFGAFTLVTSSPDYWGTYETPRP